jgi:hypothetical protein
MYSWQMRRVEHHWFGAEVGRRCGVLEGDESRNDAVIEFAYPDAGFSLNAK